MKTRQSDNLRTTANRAKSDLSGKNEISPLNATKKRGIEANFAGKPPVGRQLRSSVDQSELLRVKTLVNLRLTRALRQSEKNLRKMTKANSSNELMSDRLHDNVHLLMDELDVQVEKNSTLKTELVEVKSQLQQHQNLVKDALDTELKCAICAERMIEAVVTGACGHFFCKRCIDRSMQERRRCPICRSKCHQTAPAVAIQQLHEKLLDCLDAESRQKYAEAVKERKSEPPIVPQPNPIPVGWDQLWTELVTLANNNTPTTDGDAVELQRHRDFITHLQNIINSLA